MFRQLRQVADYIGIDVQMIATSAVYPKEGRFGPDRILDICQREGAGSYVNLPGGRNLYDSAAFAAAGIELLFLDTNWAALTLQHGGREGPHLSIIDLLMHNSVAAVREATKILRPSGR